MPEQKVVDGGAEWKNRAYFGVDPLPPVKDPAIESLMWVGPGMVYCQSS